MILCAGGRVEVGYIALYAWWPGDMCSNRQVRRNRSILHIGCGYVRIMPTRVDYNYRSPT